VPAHGPESRLVSQELGFAEARKQLVLDYKHERVATGRLEHQVHAAEIRAVVVVERTFGGTNKPVRKRTQRSECGR